MAAKERNAALKSSLAGFLSVLWDLILLNFLWLLCSLPVLTIGPATGALFSVALKLARDEEVHTAQDFLHALKANFRQTLPLGLLGLFAALVIFSDGVYAFSVEGAARTVFCVLTGFLTAVLLTYFSYVFALSVRYENTLSRQIQNAFLLALSAPGRTLAMWVFYLAPAALLLFLPQEVAVNLGFLYLMIGMSGPVWLGSRQLARVFERFENPNHEQEADHDEP